MTLDGHASQIAPGARFETLRIAASDQGCTANWRIRASEEQPVWCRFFQGDSPRSPAPWIRRRVVQRRPMPFPDGEQRRALVAAVGESMKSASSNRPIALVLPACCGRMLTSGSPAPKAFECLAPSSSGGRYSRTDSRPGGGAWIRPPLA